MTVSRLSIWDPVMLTTSLYELKLRYQRQQLRSFRRPPFKRRKMIPADEVQRLVSQRGITVDRAKDIIHEQDHKRWIEQQKNRPAASAPLTEQLMSKHNSKPDASRTTSTPVAQAIPLRLLDPQLFLTTSVEAPNRSTDVETLEKQAEQLSDEAIKPLEAIIECQGDDDLDVAAKSNCLDLITDEVRTSTDTSTDIFECLSLPGHAFVNFLATINTKTSNLPLDTAKKTGRAERSSAHPVTRFLHTCKNANIGCKYSNQLRALVTTHKAACNPKTIADVESKSKIDRPWICDTCTPVKSFAQKGHYDNHMRSHEQDEFGTDLYCFRPNCPYPNKPMRKKTSDRFAHCGAPSNHSFDEVPVPRLFIFGRLQTNAFAHFSFAKDSRVGQSRVLSDLP